MIEIQTNIFTKKIKYALVGIFLFLSSSCFSQKNIDSLCLIGICTPNGFTIPSIIGMPRSKGMEFFQERVPSYSITTNNNLNDSTYKQTIRRTKSWSAKIRVPIFNKEHFKFVVGLKYYQQQFAFKDPEKLVNTFYQNAEEKALISTGISLYAIKSFIGNKYLAYRGTFRLNGDFAGNSLLDHQKTSVSLVYGTKIHERKTWGVGISYSNTFGRSSIYPLLFYKHKFTSKWATEILLPVSIRFIYQANEKNVFYIDNKLEGDNYNLSFPEISNEPLYLEKADFKSFISYEREIYDFLWTRISGGYRKNINFDVSNSDVFFRRNFPIGNTNHLVLTNSLSDALFFRFGIFIVPPKKWLEKDRQKNE